MSILIFIIILGVLIFVHELGHFIFAKRTGMLVEEFAIGFPPRIFSFKKGETKYSIGIIPLGGYVKIFGEEYGEENGEINEKNKDRSFTQQPKKNQALVLAAGVTFNLLLAWILFAVAFGSGMPVSVNTFSGMEIENPQLMLVDVLKDSPAEKAGLVAGDSILYLNSGEDSLQNFENTLVAEDFIATHGGKEINIFYHHGNENILTTIVPEEGVVEGKFAIGVSLDMVGEVRLPFFMAIWEALKTTANLTIMTIVGLFWFVVGIFNGASSLSQISGPVGIVSMVGGALNFGFIYLLSFTALISINLAVINLIPIPALDGGRILFVLIEKIKGSPIKPQIANGLNLLGFGLLLLLMLVITVNDILNVF
ncbi:MAG: RIP metalloprotease RseP [Patescibacteria group bacterium]